MSQASKPPDMIVDAEAVIIHLNHQFHRLQQLQHHLSRFKESKLFRDETKHLKIAI